MALFACLVDPDPRRHDAYVSALRERPPSIPGLLADRLREGTFSAVWAIGENAPLSVDAQDGAGCLLLGDCVPGPGPQRLDAAQLKKRWDRAAEPPVCDGFFAAVAFDGNGAVCAFGDVLGLFPLYYAEHGSSFVISSSPGWIKRLPGFAGRIDAFGLAGTLLFSHSVGGRTLLRGVRKLGAGNVLLRDARGAIRETPFYRVRESDRYFDLSLPGQVSVASTAIASAVKRHTPAERPLGMLLSGGLDSRLVAAYARRDGVDLRALTQGRRGEGEVRVASRVARALGIDQTVVDVPSDEYPALAATHLELEQLACGFNGVHNWGLSTRMSALPPFLLTGYVMGAVFEVCDKTWSDSGVPEAPTFEWSFRNRNRWGLTPDTVRRLVRDPDVAREIDNVVDFLREDFDAGGGRASHRARVFGLRNRYRFHPGNHLWHLAFSRWPLLPGVDREVLETVAAMPQTVMYYRHLEKQVLVREFPDLARLPLDRNSWNFTPLVPTLKWLVGDAARRTAAGWLRRDPARALYYYRIYDFNGPGWRAIRERAEPLRRLGEELFSRDALLELLPRPDRRVETRDGIVESSGRKTLVGVLLWLKDNG